MPISGLIDPFGRALVSLRGEWLVVGVIDKEYRFLKDHWINGYYILAGDTASEEDLLPLNWIPTADVDPLSFGAVQAFYAAGPSLPGVINSQRSGKVIFAPVTYWYQIAPFYWALSGLGSDQSIYPPVRVQIGRVE